MTLSTAYNSTNIVDVRDYGAIGDGNTDDTTAITNAINALPGEAGTVFFPPGTYITGTQLLYSKMHVLGAGTEATIIKLKPGANANLLQGSVNGYGGGVMANIAASNASGASGGIDAWSIQNITLDGNKANQTGGTSYVLQVYGLNYRIHNVVFRNGYTGGVYSDWNAGGTVANPDVDMACEWTNFKIHDNNGRGLIWGGPHDSQFTNGLIYKNQGHNIHIGPNASAMIFENVHPWGSQHGFDYVAALIEGGYSQWSNCVFEGSDVCQVVILNGDTSFAGCHVFGTSGGGYNVSAIQIGQQASLTPISNSVNQSGGLTTAVQAGGYSFYGKISHCESANGSILYNNDGGGVIFAKVYNQAGKAYAGTISANSSFWFGIQGQASDGTVGLGGGMQINAASTAALNIADAAGHTIFVVDATNQNAILRSAAGFNWNNAGNTAIDTTLKRTAAGLVTSNGGFGVGMTNDGAIGNNASLVVFGTAYNGGSRVNPAGNVTGIKLGSNGAISGQQFTVINESAFTVTFATGDKTATGIVIAAQSKYIFAWDNGTSLWY